MFWRSRWILRLFVRLPEQELLVQQAILAGRLRGLVLGDGEMLVWPIHPLRELTCPNMYNANQGPKLLLW